MADEVPEYNTAAIRDLLLAAFDSYTLRRFCHDRILFRPIVAEFAPDDGLSRMVDKVIDYCQTRDLWGDFLSHVRDYNPRQYRSFQPYHLADKLATLPAEIPDGSVKDVVEPEHERSEVADALREKTAHRREKIKSWREAIAGFDFMQKEFGATVWYSELRVHLKPEIIARIEAPRTFIIPAEGRGDSAVRTILLDEIARIEKEWDLV